MARKKNITQVADVPVEDSIPQVTEDALLLKVNHTHAGTTYQAGTPVDEMNPSESTLGFLKEHGIV